MTDWTTQRLLSLKPGQSMVFYRGDLTMDAHRAEDDAPACYRLLLGLRLTVDELEAAGRIRVTQRSVAIPDAFGRRAAVKRLDQLVITEYTATGTEPPRKDAPSPTLTQAMWTARGCALSP